MKGLTICFSILSLALIGATEMAAPQAAPQANPRGTAELAVPGGKITIDYGRPSLKGRNVDDMIEPGRIWRTGADNPTTLTTDVPLRIGDKVVPKGNYTVLTRFIEKRKWNFILSTGQSFRPAPEDIVVEAPLSYSELPSQVEMLTIRLEKGKKGATYILEWGNLRASIDLVPTKG